MLTLNKRSTTKTKNSLCHSYESLNFIKKGETFLIKQINDPKIKCMTMRLGLCEGEILSCLHCSKGGPVVLRKKHQEIAIGHTIAKSIYVQKVS